MHPPEPPKPLIVRIQESLAASRFLTFSVLLHAVLVLMGGSVVLFKEYVEAPDFAASGESLVAADVAVDAPPEQPPEVTQTFTPQTPQINAPLVSALSTTSVTTPTFTVQAQM